MRDDSITRDARDADHIWLRQSVTFSVNGQTRTLEMALPLRPGATPDEVDALLDEADAGMRRLSQRLDAHLAEVTATPAPISAPISAPAAAPERPAPAERPAPPPARRPAAPQPAATASAPATAPTPAPTPAPASGGPDLTRPEFLAAIRALGLDARTVMERLNVRSLDGLNLRESLELLRRQSLRDGAAPEPPASSSTRPPAISDERAAALAAMPAPIGRADAARFEEEEDGPAFEVSYPDPDDLPGLDDDFAEEEFAPQEMAPAAALDDVPDGLNEPPTAPVAAAPTTPLKAEEPQEPPAVIRAREVIAALRAAHTGGQPTAQQRKAYANMVVGELGEAKAASVIRAVWSLTPDKLGPEQYDELIRWGKLDTFADEVESVLDLLRAEWIAQHGGSQPAAAQPAAPAAPTASAESPTKPAARRPAASASESAPQEQSPAPRPASRGRSASANSANSASSRADARTQGGA